MKTKILKITTVSCLSALLMFWLLPPFVKFNYRLMKYVGERYERIPGPTTNE